MDVKWTRGLIQISGFSADPIASIGTFDASNGTWSHSQSWTGGNQVSFQFQNPTGSAGARLRLSILDPTRSNPQVAPVSFSYRGEDLPPVSVDLIADPLTHFQTLENIGASMLWTIDPTEGWPVEIKEQLALKLLSEAGGIGLSGLRFDFGGGDPGTGTRTEEPWTWRFPATLKDSATSAFDWSQREGQQWFLRRSEELGIERRTLAIISPPWWMTKSGHSYPSASSGSCNLDTAQFEAFADYVADVVEHFKVNEGITFERISPINEPEWGWEGGGQEGNRGTAEDIRGIVSALHAELSDRSLADVSRIELGDHAVVNALLDDAVHSQYNGGVWNGGNNSFGKYREYLADLSNHPDMVGKVTPVASYHSYFNDSPSILQGRLRSLLAQNADQQQVGVAQTEYAILGSYGPTRDLQFEPAKQVFRTLHKDFTQANVVAWSWWLALSPHDYKDGLVYTDFDSVTDENPQLFESKVYSILGHFSRFVRPGWVRIEAGNFENVRRVLSSAWMSPDGQEVALVVANFDSQPIVANLGNGFPQTDLQIREWQPWVTDRGRSLRPEKVVHDSFLLEPDSVTTFVGRLSDGPFRLRARIHPSIAETTKGDTVEIVASATWENGRYAIPAIGENDFWIFEKSDGAAAGELVNGRYWIRRESDGFYLGSSIGEEDAVPVTLLPEEPVEWDVEVLLEGEELVLREVLSGRTLGGDGFLHRLRADSVSAVRSDLPASFEWGDGLGAEAAAQFDAVVSRWVSVRVHHHGEVASARRKIRVDAAQLNLEDLPSKIFARPGEEMVLSLRVEDLGEPNRFRLVPSDRDEVLTIVEENLGLALPQGKGEEEWELWEPSDQWRWVRPEEDRPCWIRSSSTGNYLSADSSGNLRQGEALVGESEWRLFLEGRRYRVMHEQSGLTLQVDELTGDPILGADSQTGSARFHWDSLQDDPLKVSWSHDLGSSLEVEVSPEVSTLYSVHAGRGGALQTRLTQVIVQRTFEEWSQLWFGELVNGDTDSDGDGLSNRWEFASGSSPLDAEFKVDAEIQLEEKELTISWAKSEEALGTWALEYSSNLVDWFAVEEEDMMESSSEISYSIDLDDADSGFVRLVFH